jgi:hypothetical protein
MKVKQSENIESKLKVTALLNGNILIAVWGRGGVFR